MVYSDIIILYAQCQHNRTASPESYANTHARLRRIPDAARRKSESMTFECPSRGLNKHNTKDDEEILKWKRVTRRIYVHVEHLSHSTGYNPQNYIFQKGRAPFSSNKKFLSIIFKGQRHWSYPYTLTFIHYERSTGCCLSTLCSLVFHPASSGLETNTFIENIHISARTCTFYYISIEYCNHAILKIN